MTSQEDRFTRKVKVSIHARSHKNGGGHSREELPSTYMYYVGLDISQGDS